MRWGLVNERTNTTVATRIEGAFESRTRNRGLLGRDGMDPESALILAPCSSIHTFFMRFPIDVAFVDRSGVIVRATPALAPWRIAIAFGAFAVVELPAGTLAAADTRRGDRLRLQGAETLAPHPAT